MRIIFFGTPQDVVPVVENLKKNFAVVAIVTTPDQKAGRKQLLTPSPVKQFAEKNQIAVLTPQKFNIETQEQLQHLKPDLFVVAAYGKIIPNNILTIPKHSSINIHPSLLPKYRGPTPIQTTLLHGDKQSGITFMLMDDKMDHGPILHQIPFTLESTDTFGWLMQSKFAQAGQILPHVIEEYLAGNLKPTPQDESQATYTKIITKQDGFIDIPDLENLTSYEIEKGKLEIDRKIRAFYPWPGVWTKVTIKNQEVRIKLLPKQQVQIEGKNPMNVKDFVNGYPEMKEKMQKIFY